MRRILLLLLCLFLAVVPPPAAVAQPAGATEETPALKLERWDAEATLVDKLLESGDAVPAEIEGMRATLDAQRRDIPGLIAKAEAELAPLRAQLEALGPAPEVVGTEAPEIAAERARLAEKVSAAEARLRRASQADTRAAALLSRLADLRSRIFTRQLMTRGPSIFEAGAIHRALDSIREAAATIGGEIAERTSEIEPNARTLIRLLLPLGLIAAALFLLLRVKRAALDQLIPSEADTRPRPRGVLIGLAVTLVQLLMPAAAVAMMAVAVWNSRLLGPQGEILLGGIAWALMAVVAAYALGGAFYSPHFPEYRLSRLAERDAIAASRWLMALAAVVGLDLLFVRNGERLGLALEGLEFLNTLLICCGGAALWGYAGYLVAPSAAAEKAPAAEEPEAEDKRPEPAFGPRLITAARILARATALVAPALALLGYFAAARFLFYPVVLSGAVIGVCVLLFWRVRDAVDRVAHPDEAAPSRIRLIPVIVGFLLICAAAPVLALVWGADFSDLTNAWRTISQGFQIGEVTLSPLDFFSFLLVFSIGYILTRIVQGVLARSVLPVTRLDAGGQAAVRAGVGYVGITLAALIAISATGLDLSNVAIVAGALSVGIGFGLQNVVNNFISGIILLVERPIKAGDWVQLGSGQGYVKRVNVRSTEIQTFDRASLIVPNSELISVPVINWTHTDLNGRLIVPIGVAYGTDPKKVEQILLEIARAHPMLLRRPEPYVLFRRFGADALEFEIRGVLRDVNWILNVTSEINFEIARRFAEEDIEVPFAQRDLHLKNADDLGRSIGYALKQGKPGSAGTGPASDDDMAEKTSAPKRRRRRGKAEGADADGD